MEPALTTSALRTVGSISKAAIGHYRPVGVPRIGSSEDRAPAYRRLLEAAQQLDHQVHMLRALHEDLVLPDLEIDAAPPATSTGDVHRTFFYRWNEALAELQCAVMGVRLCAPVSVIYMAERLREQAPIPWSSSKSDDGALEQHALFTLAINAFLDAARRDLAYQPRWWNLSSRYKERRFQRQVQADSSLHNPAATSPSPG
ncbi:hypothetical protein ACIHCQ_42390 [Streptomyces sp. NPDC052236]|uniref:hypothetical protein n=1 Tax=Streptomyces sp. NPDC052236 TaxID=3365686 RepID=UPI0037D0CFC0